MASPGTSGTTHHRSSAAAAIASALSEALAAFLRDPDLAQLEARLDALLVMVRRYRA